MNIPFFSTYKIKCPDGSVRIVNRNINDAFPLYIQGAQGKAKIGLNAVDEIRAEVNADFATKVQGLLFSLDDINQGIMMHFRAAYMALQSDPCGKSDYFQRQIEIIILEQNKLTSLKLKITGLINLAKSQQKNGKEILDIYASIVDELGSNISNTDAVVIAIDEIRKLAHKEAEKP